MTAPWRITNRPAANTAASASQAAPSGVSATLGPFDVVRLRHLTASLVGTAAGTGLLVVRDGATGAGTVIWQTDLSMPANGGDRVQLENLDLRASVGNALTVEFTAGGGANTQQAISAEGDIVAQGYPAFATSGGT